MPGLRRAVVTALAVSLSLFIIVTCSSTQAITPEVCDGVDNDRDGQIDEGNPGGGGACDSGQLGACQAGTLQCQAAQLACVANLQPAVEACDALDNDCDGTADEGNPGGGASCSTGQPGVCAAGTTDCSNGTIACNQNVQASAETCNALDDDCDGQTDEGNPGGGAACNTGQPGVCAAGTTDCSNGTIACNQNVQASAETCDGLDNDCDGQTDEGNPGGGAACNTGLEGVCAAGTTACTGGAIQCNQNVQASTEVCDGLDNDCDGVTDEGCDAGAR